MEQRGFYEPAEQRGSDLRSDATGRTTARLSSWSRIAATLDSRAGAVPAQRECTAAS